MSFRVGHRGDLWAQAGVLLGWINIIVTVGGFALFALMSLIFGA